MRVGFTGSQHGMSAKQKAALRVLLVELKPEELHHGDCIGADAEAHTIARELNIPVVVHPPNDPKKRAFVRDADVWLIPAPYLVRNRAIVNATFVLIVAPQTDTPKVRSGTWSTWRYAKTLKRDIRVLAR